MRAPFIRATRDFRFSRITAQALGFITTTLADVQGTSPYAHNAIDNPARSPTRVGLARTGTPPPTVHRHRRDIPSPTRAPTEARIGMA